MKWVPDRTGRFPQHPHYEMDEIDRECEQIVKSLLRKRRGRASCPIGTEELKTLVEQEAGDLDLYADLDEGVEGVTDFYAGRKPEVRIARQLTEDERRENRLRTTLMHELWHVKFHNFLYFFEQTPLTSGRADSPLYSPTCTLETMISANQSDWLEWQAGYASCAFLMPISALRRSTGHYLDTHGLSGVLDLDTSEGVGLIRHTAKAFQVSTDAARVRLLRREHLIDMR
ncbi:MAG TPA: hypothetical protein VLA19_25975 [Herpetosiphonaceae bacterium]|nr:hypothetical protein [Herpetosiphonaceae bacterium]